MAKPLSRKKLPTPNQPRNGEIKQQAIGRAAGDHQNQVVDGHHKGGNAAQGIQERILSIQLAGSGNTLDGGREQLVFAVQESNLRFPQRIAGHDGHASFE
jgi:hypothetical protein